MTTSMSSTSTSAVHRQAGSFLGMDKLGFLGKTKTGTKV